MTNAEAARHLAGSLAAELDIRGALREPTGPEALVLKFLHTVQAGIFEEAEVAQAVDSAVDDLIAEGYAMQFVAPVKRGTDAA